MMGNIGTDTGELKREDEAGVTIGVKKEEWE
jgi:hypothetical protein